MNIQHLESLYDMVERFTGVKVKERVPDYVLAQAHQVVNVDLPAEDLQERLRAGKIYPAERIERALGHFFTEREPDPAPRDRPGAGRPRPRPPPAGTRPGRESNTSERVMVCLELRSPNALRLLRKGARLADRLGAPWYAVYVQTPGERTEKVDAATQRRLADSLTLAQQLGGIPLQFKGPDLPTAVAGFVREYGITHVVVGRSRRPWYRRLFGPSLLDRLVRAVPGVDVVVVDTST